MTHISTILESLILLNFKKKDLLTIIKDSLLYYGLVDFKIYGSIIFSEETYAVVDNKLLLLSDLDLSHKKSFNNNLLIKAMNRFYKISGYNIKTDLTPLSYFDINSLQYMQRTCQESKFIPKKKEGEILEAMIIRVLYSFIEYKNSKTDIQKIYSSIRFLIEVPTFESWKNGCILPSYKARFESLSSYEDNTIEPDIIDLIKISINCKVSGFAFVRPINGNIHKAFIEVLDIYITYSEQYRDNNLHIILLALIKHINEYLYGNPNALHRIWEIYSKNIDDGKNKEKVLLKKIFK